MVSHSIFVCLATIIASFHLITATIFSTEQTVPQIAEDRIFKVKKLLGKKNPLSLFAKAPQPQIVFNLSPLEHYPIYKVHKYRGIEFRPVQVLDIPTPFDHSAVEYGVPDVDQIRVPHSEYGVPVVDYSVEQPTRSGGKLRALLGFLRSHKGFFSKLRNLKSWKQGLLSQNYALPEVQEFPVKGLESLPVPQLPSVGLQGYGSAVTGSPYVKVQVASPVNYAPQYEYQYPPQYAPDYRLPLQQNYVPRVPAPYYGAPPLYDSYGMPLPPDAYSSASSDQILAFAPPENTQQFSPENVNEEEYNRAFNGTVEAGEELRLAEKEKESEDESTKVVNNQTQINN